MTIKANIPEQRFIETLLNMKHSGCDVTFYLALYYLFHRWHFNKIVYYQNLLEEELT